MDELNNQQIIVCPNCNGLGHSGKNELLDYHKKIYKYEFFVCGLCYGSGLVKEKIHKTYQSYKPNIPEDFIA